MKQLFVILFFLLPFSSQSQHSRKEADQIKLFRAAEQFLDEINLYKAAVYFNHSYNTDRNSELGSVAKQKQDSIKQILRSRFFQKLQGEWTLIKSGSNWGYKEASKNDSLEKLLA